MFGIGGRGVRAFAVYDCVDLGLCHGLNVLVLDHPLDLLVD